MRRLVPQANSCSATNGVNKWPTNSLNHIVGARQQRQWNCEAKCLSTTGRLRRCNNGAVRTPGAPCAEDHAAFPAFRPKLHSQSAHPIAIYLLNKTKGRAAPRLCIWWSEQAASDNQLARACQAAPYPPSANRTISRPHCVTAAAWICSSSIAAPSGRGSRGSPCIAFSYPPSRNICRGSPSFRCSPASCGSPCR